MRKSYGITLERKEEIYAEQKGLCALCGEPLPGVLQSHTDYDHVTQTVRGLLHSKCNILVGWREKHAGKIVQGQNYLSKWRSKEDGALFGGPNGKDRSIQR